MKITYLPIEKLRNPPIRLRQLDEQVVQGIAETIKTKGLREPLRVRKLPRGYFEIEKGAHRKEALIIAGIKKVPCIVDQIDELEAIEMMLVQTIQRNTHVAPWLEGLAFEILLEKRYGNIVNRLAEEISLPNQYIKDRIDVKRNFCEELKVLFPKPLTVQNVIALSKHSEPEQKRLAEEIVRSKHMRHNYPKEIGKVCIGSLCHKPHNCIITPLAMGQQ